MWAADRPVGHYLSDLRINLAVDQGTPADRGNLLGIQPELFPTDYQSPERLHRKLAAYLQKAKDQGLLNEKTIVVLPEHVGTWLMVSGEKDELYQASTLKEAMNWLAASNPLKFVRALISAEGGNRLDDAHLRMKAKGMAKDYQAVWRPGERIQRDAGGRLHCIARAEHHRWHPENRPRCALQQ
jgi:predicted amidohydrolase